MKVFSAEPNDGTIIISNQFDHPTQGTLIIELDGEIIAAKGIARPLLKDPVRNTIEEEARCDVGAFGKSIPDGVKAKFFNLNALGKERARLGYQTLLFASQYPAEFIMEDNERIRKTTVLDTLSKKDKRKVAAGVSPALLVTDISPWDMIRQFEVRATRATVYGSELVPTQYNVGDYKERLSVADSMAKAFASLEQDWQYSAFMMLPGSAEDLAKQLGCKPYEMIGRWFLIHRDPALPDGTSLAPMQFAGVLEWDIESKNNLGIVIHPTNPYWKSMGGDFDGDSATVVTPTQSLLPRGPVPRYSYRIKAPLYVADEPKHQMIEYAADTFTSQLGPIILGSMRLIERGLGSATIRSAAASAAQASVEKKKHAINVEAAMSDASFVYDTVRQYQDLPYLSSFLNDIRNARGIEAKRRLWINLMEMLFIWKDGTDVEKAMVDRLEAVNQLFQDVNYFRYAIRPELPSAMRAAARAQCSTKAATVVQALTAKYSQLAQCLSQDITEGEDESLQYRSIVRNDMAAIRNTFMLGYTTGVLGNFKSTVEDIQAAVIGYAPVRIAVQSPPEAFERFGKATTRAMVNLIGDNWKTGQYLLKNLQPIPSCEADLKTISSTQVHVEVISVSKSGRSTRVMVTTC